jgi:hypothetical protein
MTEEEKKYVYELDFKLELNEITINEYNEMKGKQKELFQMIVRGYCDYNSKKCECWPGYRGEDCGIEVDC